MASLPKAPQTSLDPEDADYKSSEDSDFDPTHAADDDALSSGSEAEADEGGADVGGPQVIQKKKGRKRKGNTEAEDLGFENSGDEATIRRGQKKKRRKGGKDVVVDEEEEGGEGGLVKTRSMRAVEEKEKKPLASAAGATVDVDALWKSLNSATTKTESTSTEPEASARESSRAPKETESTGSEKPMNKGDSSIQNTSSETDISQTSAPTSSEDMVVIKRTYVFAGETITEEKLVPRSSAEARLYLQSLTAPNSAKPSPTASSTKPLRRPKKRVSQFEPNPNGVVKGLVLQGPKLNTIEKSKLDWAGYVDKEGIKDELDVAEKAKEGYLGRMDFLGRVEAKREDERKNAKMK